MLKDLLIGYGKDIKKPSVTEEVKVKDMEKRGTSTHEPRALDREEKKGKSSKVCTFVISLSSYLALKSLVCKRNRSHCKAYDVHERVQWYTHFFGLVF